LKEVEVFDLEMRNLGAGNDGNKLIFVEYDLQPGTKDHQRIIFLNPHNGQVRQEQLAYFINRGIEVQYS
jgi:hypothetical protein